jgi:hypothetical protein
MDGASFARLARERGLLGDALGRRLTPADVDLIFAGTRPRGERRIGFEEFKTCCVELCVKKRVKFRELLEKLTGRSFAANESRGETVVSAPRSTREVRNAGPRPGAAGDEVAENETAAADSVPGGSQAAEALLSDGCAPGRATRPTRRAPRRAFYSRLLEQVRAEDDRGPESASPQSRASPGQRSGPATSVDDCAAKAIDDGSDDGPSLAADEAWDDDPEFSTRTSFGDLLRGISLLDADEPKGEFALPTLATVEVSLFAEDDATERPAADALRVGVGGRAQAQRAETVPKKTTTESIAPASALAAADGSGSLGSSEKVDRRETETGEAHIAPTAEVSGPDAEVGALMARLRVCSFDEIDADVRRDAAIKMQASYRGHAARSPDRGVIPSK